MQRINKRGLAKMIAAECGIDAAKAEECVNGITSLVKEGVEHDGYAMIAGFGRFNKTRKQERVGRNPATGQTMPISARNILSFRVSAKMRRLFKQKFAGEAPREADA